MYIYIQATRRYRCDVNSELYVRSSRCIFGSARFRKRFEVPIPKFLFSRKYRNFRALWKPKALWRRTLKNPKTHRTVTTTPRILCPETLLKSISLLYISVLYPYITYPSTFRSLNLHLNSTSTFFVFELDVGMAKNFLFFLKNSSYPPIFLNSFPIGQISCFFWLLFLSCDYS